MRCNYIWTRMTEMRQAVITVGKHWRNVNSCRLILVLLYIYCNKGLGDLKEFKYRLTDNLGRGPGWEMYVYAKHVSHIHHSVSYNSQKVKILCPSTGELWTNVVQSSTHLSKKLHPKWMLQWDYTKQLQTNGQSRYLTNVVPCKLLKN